MEEPEPDYSRASKRHDPLACALWMIASCALLAGLATLGRYVVTAGVPPFQVVFLRVIFAFIALLPLIALHGTAFFRTSRWRLYGLRVFMSRREWADAIS